MILLRQMRFLANVGMRQLIYTIFMKSYRNLQFVLFLSFKRIRKMSFPEVCFNCYSYVSTSKPEKSQISFLFLHDKWDSEIKKMNKGARILCKSLLSGSGMKELTARELTDVTGFLMGNKRQKMLAGLCVAHPCVTRVFQENWKATAVLIDCPVLRLLPCTETSPSHTLAWKQFWLRVSSGVKVFLERSVSVASAQLRAWLVFSKTMWGLLEHTCSFNHRLFYQEHAY